MTSLKNYIDPALVMEMFDHYGVPYPSFLEKFMVESAAQVDGIKGPDGKPLDWDNPTPAQREAFKNMTAEEYQGFCDESIEGTDAAYDVRLLRLALSEGVEGIV
jgi:hypothetical protein